MYETADGEWVSIGSIEPQFYAQLLELTGVQHDDLPHQMDRTGWPTLRERLGAAFKAKTRAEWTEPARRHRRVLRAGAADERSPLTSPRRGAGHVRRARRHGPARARAAVLAHEAVIQGPAPLPGEHTDAVLADWGFTDAEIEALLAAGAVKQRG